jgi:hypothetical protein
LIADCLPSLDQRRRPIPKKVRAAIDIIVAGQAKTVTAAAEKARISREHLSRSLSESHIAEYLRQKAARTVALASGRASARIVELLDSESDHVSFDAARRVLSIGGIKPSADAGSINVNLNIRAGYVIDLSDDPRPPVIDVKAGSL